MGEKDIAEKNLEAWNDVFADIVNVLLFKGRQVVKEHELETAIPTSTFKSGKKLHQQERDVAKFWKNGEIRISLLGFENQSASDPKMPLRVISYDGASYKQQLLDKKLKKNFPVITLVLYFGEEHWKSARTLYECLDVPEDLKPFANDYKINVFEIAWLDEGTIGRFTSDFKIVAEYFQAKRLKKDYAGSTEMIRHVDETLKMLSALTGDNSFETVYNESTDLRNGGASMCEVIQKIVDKGRAEGRAEGRTAGREELILKLLESRKITAGQIADMLEVPVETIEEIARKSTATEAALPL